MIGHKLPNKTKNATVAEPKLFHQLNNPVDVRVVLPFVCTPYNKMANRKFRMGSVGEKWVKVTVVYFIVIWQNLSNHRLTRLKRFVSTFTNKLCN
jgi:hypothetical protein